MAVKVSSRRIRVGGITVITSTATTRAAIVTLDGGKLDIGSIHLSTTDGRMHVKVAHGEADTDWSKVTMTAAD
jgi:hypothetical protein